MFTHFFDNRREIHSIALGCPRSTSSSRAKKTTLRITRSSTTITSSSSTRASHLPRKFPNLCTVNSEFYAGRKRRSPKRSKLQLKSEKNEPNLVEGCSWKSLKLLNLLYTIITSINLFKTSRHAKAIPLFLVLSFLARPLFLILYSFIYLIDRYFSQKFI